jgi:hypothetical protein
MGWEVVGNTGTTAIHAALVATPSGAKIVYFGGYFGGESGVAERFDCETRTIDPEAPADTPDAHIFCSGHALLADGRWLIAGGLGPSGQNVPHDEHEGHDDGDVRAHLYNPRAGTWVDAERLSFQPGSKTVGGGRWYPTLVTLASGDVLCASGHPSIDDHYPAQDPNAPYAQRRHCNNTPERYSPADTWTLLTLERTTAQADRDEYPRMHLTPSAHVFWATQVWDDDEDAYASRWYDAYTGAYAGSIALPADDGYHVGSSYTTVLLPLLPNDPDHAWVLGCGGTDPIRADVVAGGGWQPAGARQLDGKPVRVDGCAVLLPTGQVFVTGGTQPAAQGSPAGAPRRAVKRHEIYTPAIDWTNDFGVYTGGEGSWTAAGAAAGASVARGYHNTALLMPDGAVWTAGSTDRASLENAGTVSTQEGSATVTLDSGSFDAADLDAEFLVPGAGPPDEGSPTDLYARIVDVVSATEATLSGPAGVTTSGANAWWGPFDEKRIEIWEADWYDDGDRPRIDLDACQPSVAYGEHFDVPLAEPATIGRVALTRCGSVTHAFDSDQRYVVCEFEPNGATLEVRAPTSSAVAPPGNYLLWVLNAAGKPAERAAFVRLTHQGCKVVNNHSTFSVLEAEALQEPQGTGPATFPVALLVFFEGFMPHELGPEGTAPEIVFRLGSANGPVVDGMSAVLSGQAFETAGADSDHARTWIFDYDVVFDGDLTAFGFDGSDEPVHVEATWGRHRCEELVQLSKDPNPYMTDGKTTWLSDDLRVFTIQPGGTVGAIEYPPGESPTTFIQNLLELCNGPDPGDPHPFDTLPAGYESSALELDTFDANDVPHYNFALARVRYRANVQKAEMVKVFFRLFDTWGPAMEFDRWKTYRRYDAGPNLIDSAALLGRVGPELYSIPFFAEPRVTPQSSMNEQVDANNRGTIEPKGGEESFRYYGCWLDVNQDEHHLPYDVASDGPYYEDPLMGGPLQPIADKIRGTHQCLIAEILYEPDLTDHGDSPESSDNLAQRNIAWAPVGNPGAPATRTALHTFLVKPSAGVVDPSPGRTGKTISSPMPPIRRRGEPDALVFWWNLPAGSTITLYMPRVSADEVLTLAARRLGPPALEKADEHTIRAHAGEVTILPLPGGTDRMIPGLVSVELPDGIVHGEHYSVLLRQISGTENRVVGTAELAIPVRHEAELLPGAVKELAQMKRVFLSMREDDPWHPVFLRYLAGLADRVRGFGGDPDAVEPTSRKPKGERPGGTRPGGGGEPGGTGPRPEERASEGKVCRLLYDCHGDFEGFVLDSCGARHAFATCDRGIEEVVRRACAERSTVTVYAHRRDPRRPLRIAVHCC